MTITHCIMKLTPLKVFAQTFPLLAPKNALDSLFELFCTERKKESIQSRIDWNY